MRNVLRWAVLAAPLWLAGCGLMEGLGPPDVATPAIVAQVVGPKTVVLDASAFAADLYTWSFGDGETVEGAGLAVVAHTYADFGVYVVRLELAWEGPGAAGGCRTCPGGGGTAHRRGTTSAQVVVDLRGCLGVSPAITMIGFTGDVVPEGGAFLGWNKATFSAAIPGAPYPVEEYVFRWTVEVTAYYRVEDTWEPHVYVFRSADQHFVIPQIPASGACPGNPPRAHGVAVLEIWGPQGCHWTTEATFEVAP